MRRRHTFSSTSLLAPFRRLRRDGVAALGPTFARLMERQNQQQIARLRTTVPRLMSSSTGMASPDSPPAIPPTDEASLTSCGGTNDVGEDTEDAAGDVAVATDEASGGDVGEDTENAAGDVAVATDEASGGDSDGDGGKNAGSGGFRLSGAGNGEVGDVAVVVVVAVIVVRDGNVLALGGGDGWTQLQPEQSHPLVLSSSSHV